MFELCLTSLLSGTIAVSGLGQMIDYNNEVVYDFGKHTQYVIADKYALSKLCGKPTRFAEKPNNFQLISVLGSDEEVKTQPLNVNKENTKKGEKL